MSRINPSSETCHVYSPQCLLFGIGQYFCFCISIRTHTRARNPQDEAPKNEGIIYVTYAAANDFILFGGLLIVDIPGQGYYRMGYSKIRAWDMSSVWPPMCFCFFLNVRVYPGKGIWVEYEQTVWCGIPTDEGMRHVTNIAPNLFFSEFFVSTDLPG